MEIDLFIIKIWVFLQFIIIILLILFFTITRLIVYKSIKNHKENKQKINELLIEINDNPNALTSSMIQFFNRSILQFLLCLVKADKTNHDNPNWDGTKKLLSDHVLKNQAKKLSSSKSWFKKYLTILCYELGSNIEDEKTLLKFIKDDNLIISANAAKLIFQKPNPASINDVINTLSKGRHILQTTFANMLMSIPYENINLIRTTFIERLNEESNIYVRIFCYHVLNQLERSDKIDPFVEKDLFSENVDLKILALKYVAHVNQTKSISILLEHLNDARSEVRSTVVRLLGELGDKSIIPYLKEKLNDSEWWVRINSANGLLSLGAEGIAVLNEQSPKDSKFAYETAQACLKIYQYSKENENIPA